MISLNLLTDINNISEFAADLLARCMSHTCKRILACFCAATARRHYMCQCKAQHQEAWMPCIEELHLVASGLGVP